MHGQNCPGRFSQLSSQSFAELYVSPSRFCRYRSDVHISPFVPLSPLLTIGLGTGSICTRSKGWQKYAMLYLSWLSPPGKITRWTVLFNSPPVQNCIRSPMLTKIGGKASPLVPGGRTGTDDHAESGVRTCSPGCESRWKRRVREPTKPVSLVERSREVT